MTLRTSKPLSDVSLRPFGQTADGRTATLYTLQNQYLRVRITDFGARMVSIKAPDRWGHCAEVLLGFDDVQAYASAGGSFGAVLGRTANRIAGGTFDLDGRTYRLPTNDRGSTLHGGPVGFGHVLWDWVSVTNEPKPTLVLKHVSPDGDQGFPGECTVHARYRLEVDCLWLDLEARCTHATPLSLSAHPYFNLAGPHSRSILDHRVTILAAGFLPTDDKQIPTGEVRDVTGTPFDFRSGAALGARIRQPDPQLLYGQGYDHYYVLAACEPRLPRLAAQASELTSGRLLELYCTQPGLQLYTGNQLNGSVAGRGGIYRQSAGFSLEPQEYPDAVHHPNLPSSILRPQALYSVCMGYRFRSIEEHEEPRP
ncbi:MAG TPA: aldose epimerase family protein [Steroidobacteraceae bacterium]|jgi:aldose 1-epimerase